MTATAAQPVVPLQTDAAGRLTEDLHCMKCGYNLRGADAEGKCPECGLAVGRSALGHWLRYCDPGWLASIWQGLILIGVLAGSIGLLVLFARLGWFYDFRGKWGDTLTMLLPTIVAVTASVLGVIGLWKATRQDPARLGDEWPINARRTARVLLIGVVASFVGLPIVAYHLGVSVDGDAMEQVLPLAMLGGLLAILWHAQGLASRIPARALRRCTLLVLVVLGVSGAWWHVLEFNTLGLKTAIDSVYIRFVPRNRGWVSSLNSFEGVGQWGVAIGLLGTLALLAWYWQAMKRQADLAKRTWART